MVRYDCDLLIIGAGPAGLSAAINGASELPKVFMIDSGKKKDGGGYRRQLGGQAIGSSAIKNYPGFPFGATGCELMARFEKQAIGLGAHVLCPEHAYELKMDGKWKCVRTREGSEIITNGLSYRKMMVPNVHELLGRGVLYGAPTSNPRALGACRICIVGGANSAGQAAVHLAQNSEAEIAILVRNPGGIRAGMSKYLADEIEACKNVRVIADVSVMRAWGKMRLEGITLGYGDGSSKDHPTDHLFIFIGAEPKVSWLGPCVRKDPRGFVLTGNRDLGISEGVQRLAFETSLSGVFAAGDVRFRSVKRVAAGVGEGSAAIGSVHRYLAGNGF